MIHLKIENSTAPNLARSLGDTPTRGRFLAFGSKEIRESSPAVETLFASRLRYAEGSHRIFEVKLWSFGAKCRLVAAALLECAQNDPECFEAGS